MPAPASTLCTQSFVAQFSGSPSDTARGAVLVQGPRQSASPGRTPSAPEEFDLAAVNTELTLGLFAEA
jgi:hypothetical protein